MRIKVLKFGGTSVKDENCFKKVCSIIINTLKEDYKVVAVLSATATTTDNLIKSIEFAVRGEKKNSFNIIEKIKENHLKIIKSLGITKNINLKMENLFNELEILLKGIFYLKEFTPKAYDAIVSTGELLSTNILYHYFKEFIDQRNNINTELVDARNFLITDKNFTIAKPDLLKTRSRIKSSLLKLFKNNVDLIITQGFIGSTENGITTTLGRGGSDFTASIIGYSLSYFSEVEVIEIWTDVSGIYTADPRVVEDSYPLKYLSFKESAELAFFGAKVLHPDTILPAMKRNIPVIVKNTMKPSDYGTIIANKTEELKNKFGPEKSKYSESKLVIKGIAFRKNITLITIESTRMLNSFGFLAKIFEIFAEYGISIDLISTSEITVSVSLDNNNFNKEMIKKLKEFSNIYIKKHLSIISLIGDNLKLHKDFLSRVFLILRDIPIDMITFGASNINLSIVVEDKYTEKAVKLLHKEFFKV